VIDISGMSMGGSGLWKITSDLGNTMLMSPPRSNDAALQLRYLIGPVVADPPHSGSKARRGLASLSPGRAAVLPGPARVAAGAVQAPHNAS